ncbi:Nudix hydrolase isoform 1 [Dorcoceras hygrometricum]|uniref:Nudix hydrolase isoform 1 n=1 Tax=Dorcoceras hygrometricum TaxID=472368 RepID=A0A2Z7AQ45_9LAMI|nr:Nudix hydrolase isoform 1 [Dorcoceras hygrometricum]
MPFYTRKSTSSSSATKIDKILRRKSSADATDLSSSSRYLLSEKPFLDFIPESGRALVSGQLRRDDSLCNIKYKRLNPDGYSGLRSFSSRSTESPVFKPSLTTSSNAASSQNLKLSSRLNVLDDSLPVPSNHQLSVVFDPACDRIPHPDANLENSISEVYDVRTGIWDRRVQQNPSLYNGLKFRYGGHNIGGGIVSSQEPDVCLHLGLTDYRTFVGTNLNPRWERFLFPSEAWIALIIISLHQNSGCGNAPDILTAKEITRVLFLDDWRRCQHTSNPLGNGAIVETAEKEIVVLQRSTNVGEFPGHFVFPGGHPEPQEVGITSHYCNSELSHQMVNSMASHEMFDSIIREVVEEIGVPTAALGNPVFIGVSQRVLNVRPTAFFFIKCSLQSKEIQHLYYNAQDKYESIQLRTMSMNDVAEISSKMPGCHQGGFALYKLMVDAGYKN